MPIVPFRELMADAEQHGYAAGYFESWNLESLLAVADAAEATRSPVILGASGLYLPSLRRVVPESLAVHAALLQKVGRALTVPCCLLFNESPALDWVMQAVDLGFGLVMYSDENLPHAEEVARVRQVAERAHAAGAAVEAELAAPPGLDGELKEAPEDRQLSDPEAARAMVAETGADALAVTIGQVHMHGRSQVRLDFERLARLRAAVKAPLVLHGATSVRREDLARAARAGIRKINVGSSLKRAFFEALRGAANAAGEDFNPYNVLGSGYAEDVLAAGRLAMRAVVADYTGLFGSAGRG